MNSAVIIGRLVKDVELRYTSTNTSIATFIVAVHRNYKNQDGETETDFINCKAFKERADLIEKYTKKCDLIAVSGSIRTGSYEKEDGSKVYTTELVVENINFLQPKEQNTTNSESKEGLTSFKAEDLDLDDSDLPF